MAASATLRGVFALLLALSVGGKLIANSRAMDGAWPALEKSQIVDFFNRHGFVAGDTGDDAVSPFVQATAGDCHLLAVHAAPQGWHRDIVRRMASPQEEVFFVLDGAMNRDQPVWLTWTRHYWAC